MNNIIISEDRKKEVILWMVQMKNLNIFTLD